MSVCCVLSHFSCCVQLFSTSWTIALQAPLPMGFSRQKYWRGLPRAPPGDLPDSGIESAPLKSSAPVAVFFTTSTTLCNRGTGPQLARKKAIKQNKTIVFMFRRRQIRDGRTAELKFPVYLFRFYFNVEPPSSN